MKALDAIWRSRGAVFLCERMEKAVDAEWRPVAYLEMRGRLKVHYMNVEIILGAMKKGQEIQTPFAWYRLTKQEVESCARTK